MGTQTQAVVFMEKVKTFTETHLKVGMLDSHICSTPFLPNVGYDLCTGSPDTNIYILRCFDNPWAGRLGGCHH